MTWSSSNLSFRKAKIKSGQVPREEYLNIKRVFIRM